MACGYRRVLVVGTAWTMIACHGELSGDSSRTLDSADGGRAATDAAERTRDAAAGDEDAASEIDAGTVARHDAGTPIPQGVPVFVAQGHMGRTTISCDGGRTWVADRSLDDAVRCFSNGFDCDHHTGAANGIAFGGGHFFATFGWGPPGSVQRSGNGIEWTSITSQTTFGGVAFLGGRLLAGARSARVTSNLGMSWTTVDTGLAVWNVRRTGHVEHDGGRFVLVGEDGGTRDILLSRDGMTWDRPRNLPDTCGASAGEGGIASGRGTIVILGGDGVACRSTDGGQTFTATNVNGSTSQLVWDGTAFRTWTRGSRFSSADGAEWTRESITPDNVDIGAIARGDDGTLVMVNGGWNRWYDQQTFYRSTDGGLTWTRAESFRGGHPIRRIAFGRLAQRPSACE